MKRLLPFSLLSLWTFISCVPSPTTENTLQVSGKVVQVQEGGTKDVVIRIEDDPSHYYINRGLENGLTLEMLQKKLEGKEVLLKYPDMWKPLDLSDKVHHLYHVQLGAEVIYSEIPEA